MSFQDYIKKQIKKDFNIDGQNDFFNFKDIPDYYKAANGYEARKVIEGFQPDNYNIGTAITYLLRAGKKKYVNDSSKDSLKADIEKAINHLNFELDRL